MANIRQPVRRIVIPVRTPQAVPVAPPQLPVPDWPVRVPVALPQKALD